MEKRIGRPPEYTDGTRVFLNATGASKLQDVSDRRAIVMFLVDSGGVSTLGEVNRHFGFDISKKVRALARSGWVRLEAPE